MLEELEECVEAGEDPGTILEAKGLTRTIAAFLDALPTRDANVFLRRYFFLEDASAISARYGLRRDAVNQSLSRTRKKLRKSDFRFLPAAIWLKFPLTSR